MSGRWLALCVACAAGCSFVPSGPGGTELDAGDAATLDAATLDAATLDAATLDAPAPDAAIDASAIDAALPDAGPVDAAVDAGTTTSRALVDDTVADFDQGTPLHLETRLEAAGAVAPRAYYLGSLCAAGSDARLFDDGHTADGSVLPAPAKLGLARTVDLNVPAGFVPAGVGITAATDFTLWWFGELRLTAGAHTFGLAGDDHAFLEVAPPGVATPMKILGVNVGESATAMFVAPVDGWYAFRVAVAQRGGAVDLSPRLDGVPITRYQTRCRVDAVSGLAQTGFDESHFLDVGGTTIATTSVADIDWGLGQPGDLGIRSADTFSVRWAGQWFVAVAGTYRLRIRADDGYRLWIDGVRVASDLSDGNHDTTTADLSLAVGWHDVVFDTFEAGFGARSMLSVSSGPELVGMALPVTRLRPAEARSERFESAHAASVDEPGPAVFAIAVAAGATVSGVDVGYQLDPDPLFTSVTTTLRDPITNTILRNGTMTGDTIDRFHPTAWNGMAWMTPWGIGFDVQGGGGRMPQSWLTVHYQDVPGTGPTPTTASFESSVRDLFATGDTAVVALDTVTLDVRTAPGAVVTIAFRTCDAPAACAAAPWSGEFASGNPLTGVPPRRYLQYRLRFTTDGDHEPAVLRVQLDYRTQ